MELLNLHIVMKIIVTILLLGFIGLLVRLFNALVMKPERVRSKLRNQGIQGPPPSFLIGNARDMMKKRVVKDSKLAPKQEDDHHQQQISHNYHSVVFPFFKEWREQYGQTFVFSTWNKLTLHITDPELVKELNTFTYSECARPFFEDNDFFGKGILGTTGEEWARQRKILAPEFYMSKVKGMTKLMAQSALMVVKSWNDKIDSSEGGVAEVKIDSYLRSFSGDVISRACFGSNYEEGEQIFNKIRALIEILSRNLFLNWIPGFRYLPIKSNREMWRLLKEFRALLLKLVNERKELASPNSDEEKDLLQILIECAERSHHLGQEAKIRFILDNCKNIYFAGYDTTAVAATWTLMLLALYPEWQDKVRAEVLQVCAGKLADADMLPKLKILTMVIYESLRLYSGTILPRAAAKDLKLGGFDVPKGVGIWVVVTALHHDPNLWGPDVDEFKPERFSNGVSGACKVPQAFVPFGTTPHTCLGQFFATAELKILLALILSNFALTLSPNYRHSPKMKFLIEPEHGVDLLVRSL